MWGWYVPYGVLSFAYILLEAKGRVRACRWLKGLLMPSLLCGHILAFGRPDAWLAAGLVLGCVGDVALESTREHKLPLGIGAFLLGHVCYIVALSLRVQWAETEVLWILIAAACYVACTIICYVCLQRALGVMRVPGAAYMAVIFAMSFLALCWLMQARTARSAAAWFGSIFFIVSDLVLAMQIFGIARERRNGLVMSTYCIAQWLVTVSLAMR